MSAPIPILEPGFTAPADGDLHAQTMPDNGTSSYGRNNELLDDAKQKALAIKGLPVLETHRNQRPMIPPIRVSLEKG